MTIQGQNNKYHKIKKDSRDKREDPTWYPQVPWLLKGTLISATANHHRPSKDGFRPVGHVRIKRVQGSMHMGSDLPFLDHIIYPHHLLSPDQSVYTVELPWLSLNKNDHPRTTTSITGSKRILETRRRIPPDTHRCHDCSKAHLFQPRLIIIALARTPLINLESPGA